MDPKMQNKTVRDCREMANLLRTTNRSVLLLSVFCESHIELQPIIPDDIRLWVETLLNVLILVFGMLGVTTNAINIRVFIHQGVTSDSSTIGLFSLAVSDFLGCILLIPGPICEALKYIPGQEATVVSCSAWFALIFPVQHIVMSRMTCWITVYIAVERSICVLIPFKAKILIRPKFTMSFMIMLFIVGILLGLPNYIYQSVKSVYSPVFNATISIYTETPKARIVRKYLSLISNTISSSVAVIVTAIATGLMLYKLSSYSKWRKKISTTGSGKDDNDPQQSDSGQGKKDVEVLKTVVMVTGLFLVCLSMSHVPGFASYLVPGFTITGINRNIFYLFYIYKFVFDLINSSLNFFFYIRISSRFIASFNEVFGK